MGRRSTSLVVCAVLVLTLSLSSMVGAQQILKAGHVIAPTHPYHLGLIKFAELVEERTGGRYKIEVYHSGQLGNERDMIEGVQMGTLDITLVATGPVSNFVPSIAVVDLPFLFSSYEHADRVLDGPIGQRLLEDFKKARLVGLAFWENGFRNITNSKRPINEAGDVRGLKIRTMENQIHQASFQALGADPVPMAWGEAYTALQQKTIDGQENPIPNIFSLKVHEIQKYIAMTGHFYSPAPLIISRAVFEKMSSDDQVVFLETAREVAVYERELNRAQEDECLEKMKAAGNIITYPDRKAFRDATKVVYDRFGKKFGEDLIADILAAE
ncbi:MAG: TRAP transporter substrate-binding protein [Limnochordia bacterium]|jgi:tripartite ATP-independent transporter DctP family solute receptor